MSEDARARASESMAERFTRVMKATTSPLGVLTDPPLIGTAVAVLTVTTIVLFQLGALTSEQLPVAFAVVASPVVIAIAALLALFGARDRVVEWLAAQPFPIDNMNAVLNGVAQDLVVVFEGEIPTRDELNERLEQAHPDAFALDFEPGAPREITVRIGIIPESKINPTGVNRRRYQRVQTIVEEVLVPLHAELPIAAVRAG